MPRLTAVLVLLVLLPTVAPRSGTAAPAEAAAPAQATVYVRESGAPGPTVLLVAGMHGNEVASTYAADQIRQWPLERGRLIVVPRANPAALAAFRRETPGVAKGLGNLNRNFPRAGRDEEPRGPLAEALWSLVTTEQPDWIVDLHESVDFHRRNPKWVGATLIPSRDPASRAMAHKMAEAVDATITETSQKFTVLRRAVDGSLVRAVDEHVDAHAMICETACSQPRSVRARQHRILIHRLLSLLDMIDASLPVDTLGDRQAWPGRTVVGLYDAGGAGGKGIPALWSQLRRRRDLHVQRIGPPEVRAGALTFFDVVIFPGGSGSKQAAALGKEGREALRTFVRDGGGYVGICAGAYLACRSFSWGAHLLDAGTAAGKWQRGRATLEIELTERGREILGQREDILRVIYANGPILVPAEDAALPDYEPLALFRTEVAENGSRRGVQIGSPAIACGTLGDGRVIVYSPHPEQTRGLAWLVERGVRWAASGSVASDAAASD